MPRVPRRTSQSNSSRSVGRSLTDVNPYFTPSLAPSTPNQEPLSRTQISNNVVDTPLAHEEIGFISSKDKNVRSFMFSGTSLSVQHAPSGDPQNNRLTSVSDPASNETSANSSAAAISTPQPVLPDVLPGSIVDIARPATSFSPGHVGAVNVGIVGQATNTIPPLPVTPVPAPNSTPGNNSVSPLTPEQIVALQQLCQQLFPATTSAQPSQPSTPVALNTRSRRSTSQAPAHRSDDDENFLDSDSDSDQTDDEPLGDKHPKPKGEISRIVRGGYNLTKIMIDKGWTEAEVDRLAKTVKHWMTKYLNTKELYSKQDRVIIRRIRQMAKAKFPELEKFHNLWPVDDILRAKLKYSKEAHLSAEREHMAAFNANKKRPAKRK